MHKHQSERDTEERIDPVVQHCFDLFQQYGYTPPESTPNDLSQPSMYKTVPSYATYGLCGDYIGME